MKHLNKLQRRVDVAKAALVRELRKAFRVGEAVSYLASKHRSYGFVAHEPWNSRIAIRHEKSGKIHHRFWRDVELV